MLININVETVYWRYYAMQFILGLGVLRVGLSVRTSSQLNKKKRRKTKLCVVLSIFKGVQVFIQKASG